MNNNLKWYNFVIFEPRNHLNLEEIIKMLYNYCFLQM